ncbi:MAG: HD domain-containing protein, partial [Gammaproteobacteria bacterium]
MAEPALHPAPSDTQLDAWLISLRANYGDAELALVRHALAFSAQSQAGDSSRLDDARAIAQILCDLHMDHETIAAALLHSAGATDDATHVEKIFGPAISRLTDGVNRMAIAQDLPDQPDERKKQQAHAESLRKMLLAIAEDLRVVLIKLAQRLHGMRRINDLP